MSTVIKTAVIDWIPHDQGGRWAPPTGLRYSTLVRFGSNAVAGNWSLVVDLIRSLDGALRWLANVHFLVEEAPQHLLVSGAEFTLHEGWKCVAHGRIV